MKTATVAAVTTTALNARKAKRLALRDRNTALIDFFSDCCSHSLEQDFIRAAALLSVFAPARLDPPACINLDQSLFLLESQVGVREPRRPMSVFGNTSAGSQTGGQYGRADLQSAFNWLIHQPEHVRKQATDPDRLMTLFFRSQGSASSRPEPQERMETAAPVSSLNFISDLRQINEAMRQFDGPSAVSQMISTGAIPAGVATGVAAGVATVGNGAAVHTPVPPPPTAAGLHTKTLTAIAEVREKLNLSSDTEAVNLLISIGVKAIRPLLG